MKLQSNLVHIALAGVVGAVAAVGTLKLLDDGTRDGASDWTGTQVEAASAVGRPPVSHLAGEDLAPHLRALQRRVSELEAETTELSEDDPTHAAQPSDGAGTMVGSMSREEALRQVHGEFERQAETHYAEPLDAVWRARTEALVTQQGAAQAEALGLALDDVSCRSTSCIVEFTAPNNETRELTQGHLATANFGEGCAKLVVAFPSDDPEARQAVRMIVDCRPDPTTPTGQRDAL